MTSRDIIKTILRKEVPERMGLYEHYWQETLTEEWTKQGLPEGVVPEYHFGYDIVRTGGFFDTVPFPGRSDIVEENDEWRVIRDGRGATLRSWKNRSGAPEHIDFEVTTPEKWKEYREPLLETDPARLGDFEAIRHSLSKAREAGKFSVYGDVFIFGLMRDTLGHQNFLPALSMEPDWIRDFCQVYLDMYRRHYEILFREAGMPDGIFIYEDFSYNKGLFCSPSMMRELILPYHKELISFFKDYGLPVLLHSCGDIREAVFLIIDTGFDCLQPMEAKAGCDVLDLAGTFGNRISYMGNINVVALSTNDRAQVEAEIVPKLRALREKRVPYVFHSDHSIPPDVTLETYEYALELFWENCRY